MFFLRFSFSGKLCLLFFSVLHMNKNSDFVLEMFINLLVKIQYFVFVSSHHFNYFHCKRFPVSVYHQYIYLGEIKTNF